MLKLLKYLPRLFKILPKLGNLTKLLEEAKKMDGVKPGWKTSEFYGKVIVQVLAVIAALSGVIPEEYALIAVTILEGVYNIIRGVVKAKSGKELPPLPAKPV